MTPVTEPVIGLRRFRITNGDKLGSIVVDNVWKEGVNEAACLKARVWQPLKHPYSPADKCSCGIYAYHEISSYRDTTPNVRGVIRGWGKVRVHPEGWRAQYGELLALFDDPQSSEKIRKVAKRYNVPVLPSSYSVELLASEFGPFVPKDIRPVRTTETSETYMVADYLLWLSTSILFASTAWRVGRRLYKLYRQINYHEA